MKTAVLIPCYNEEITIEKVIKKNYQMQKFMYIIIIQKIKQQK